MSRHFYLLLFILLNATNKQKQNFLPLILLGLGNSNTELLKFRQSQRYFVYSLCREI